MPGPCARSIYRRLSGTTRNCRPRRSTRWMHGHNPQREQAKPPRSPRQATEEIRGQLALILNPEDNPRKREWSFVGGRGKAEL